jgi:hypothetical protein
VATSFTFEQFKGELARDAELPKKAVAVIRRTVKLQGPAAVQKEIASFSRQPVDRGMYRQSFRFEDIPDGATAYNFAMYAPIIEYGRRPGQKAPPIEAIMAWVLRKGIGRQFGPNQAGKRRVTGKLDESRARGIAFTIARAIKKRGLPAHLVLQHASEHIDQEINQALQELLESDRA